MFERFTDDARQTVVTAQDEARALRHGWIGTEHLLLALLAGHTPTAAVLAAHGLHRAAVLETLRGYVRSNDLDGEALRAVGIDLDAVRESVEAVFGPGALDARMPSTCTQKRGRSGHIPFSPRTKKVLELALREAVAGRDAAITDAHIGLGLLREGQGLAARILSDRGVDLQRLREDLTSAVRA